MHLIRNNVVCKQGSFSMWNHLDDEKLYTDNDYALEKIRDDQKYFESKTIFHTYWHGDFGRKHAFSLKSLICTQDLDKIEIYLWLDVERGYSNYLNNKFITPLLPYITVKPYDIFNETIGKILPKDVDKINSIGDVVHKGDVFRFIILEKYGGVYFDPDIMFLRSFEPLLQYEFCYAWECQQYANSAILSLRKHSYLSNYILYKGIKKKFFYPWVTLQYSDPNLASLFIYPCALFDPLWMYVEAIKKNEVCLKDKPYENFDGFFAKFNSEFIKKSEIKSYKDFFKGAFTYHWHNRWFVNECEDSYFGLFEKEFENFLRNKEFLR